MRKKPKPKIEKPNRWAFMAEMLKESHDRIIMDGGILYRPKNKKDPVAAGSIVHKEKLLDMTKVTEIPKNQIDDVIWTDDHLFAYHSRPGDTEPGENDFVKVPLSDFHEFLETNNHLVAMVPMPYLTADGYEDDPQPCNITPEEFRLLENSYTWPIILNYLRFKKALPKT